MSGGLHDPFDDDRDRSREDDCPPADDTAVQELCRLALAELDEGDAERARDLAAEAIGMDADHPYPLFVLGVVAENEGDLAAAAYLSERALRLAASNADLIQFRAQVLLRTGEAGEALKLLRYGVAMHPADPELHAQLARTLLACGHSDEAQGAALSSIRLDATNAAAREVLHAAGGDEAAAEDLLAALRQAALMNPDDPYIQLELASAELHDGNTDRAHRLMVRAHRLAPNDRGIALARRMLAYSYESRWLAPLPLLRRWMDSFPGRFAGFVAAAFLVGIPLVALARADAAVAPAVAAVLALWVGVAAYMWVGPRLADLRFNRAAADAARRAAPGELGTVADAATVCVAAGHMQRAHRIAIQARRQRILEGEITDAVIAELDPTEHRLRARLVSRPLLAELLPPLGYGCAATAVLVSTSLPAAALALGGAAMAFIATGTALRRARSHALRAAAALGQV